ncbi:PTS transporter subunit EIIC [Mesoplasma photuris]|uniref:PTS transporter subunit EIIC n=1 Tax=Mesoplasma photuris TaxID=217731 RepID=UPI0004E1131E|nr:PTS transporter subunit EIIC [Mesoplasma photuris]
MAKPNKVAQDLLDIIKSENIVSFTNCMTRLRVKAKPNFDADQLKQVDGVLGLVISGDEYQIILGPGFVNKVATEFAKIVDIQPQAEVNEMLDKEYSVASAAELAKLEKTKRKSGGGKSKEFLAKISKVFTPLIPAFIGAGLLSGISGILTATIDASPELASWISVLTVMLSILTNVFIVAVGWRMAEEWGANPGLAALVAAIYTPFAGAAISGIFSPMMVDGHQSYNFLGMIIDADNIESNWFTVGFVNLGKDGVPTLGAPHAGLIGAMIAAAFTIALEKQFRKFMPGAIDTILTPILVIVIMLFANFVFIIPAAGYLFTGITWLMNNLYANPFGAAVLSGIFLFALAFGVHQGFLPIYFALMADESTGFSNPLFPIMAMGGVAQVGVCIGMWFLAGKGSTLRKQISGAIIPGFMGIGEPLIYGIALPRVKPFVLSCLAATFGGFFIGALSTWGGITISMNAATGPGGLVATIMMTTTTGNVALGISMYLLAVVITYAAGIGICFFAYSKIARYGTEMSKTLYKNWIGEIKTKETKAISLGVLKIIGLSVLYATVIGLVSMWIIEYKKLDENTKNEYSNFQLV